MGPSRPSIRELLACAALLAAACAAVPREEAEVAGAHTVVGGHTLRAPVPAADRAGARIEPRLEATVYVLANRTRVRAGVPPLELRADLSRVARAHALDMACRGYFSHRSPEGRGPGDRAAHLPFLALGENLARVRYARHPGPLAIRGWLESPAHRRVLLDERGVNYRYTGVGAATAGDGTVYVAQLFMK